MPPPAPKINLYLVRAGGRSSDVTGRGEIHHEWRGDDKNSYRDNTLKQNKTPKDGEASKRNTHLRDLYPSSCMAGSACSTAE